jgi:hypothetical protein
VHLVLVGGVGGSSDGGGSRGISSGRFRSSFSGSFGSGFGYGQAMMTNVCSSITLDLLDRNPCHMMPPPPLFNTYSGQHEDAIESCDAVVEQRSSVIPGKFFQRSGRAL